MSVPYTFASATGSIPLAELDANFATPITLGSSPMILGGTYTSISGLTLSNPTLSSAILGTPTSGNLSGCSGYLPTNLGSGLVPLANLATGTPSSATYLRGDQTWGASPSASSLATANFTVSQIGTKLYFQYNGANIASLDASGNFTSIANVTAYGTP